MTILYKREKEGMLLWSASSILVVIIKLRGISLSRNSRLNLNRRIRVSDYISPFNNGEMTLDLDKVVRISIFEITLEVKIFRTVSRVIGNSHPIIVIAWDRFQELNIWYHWVKRRRYSSQRKFPNRNRQGTELYTGSMPQTPHACAWCIFEKP